jgi:hypothetical protein
VRQNGAAAAAIGAVIIVVAMFTGFKFFPDEETTLTNLLEDRTNILQYAYYGRISRDVAKTLLLKIETSPLSAQDEKALTENTDGEMDIVRNMYLTEYELISKGKDEASCRIAILWEMQGITETYQQQCTYLIRMVKTDGKMKLAEMTYIE